MKQDSIKWRFKGLKFMLFKILFDKIEKFYFIPTLFTLFRISHICRLSGLTKLNISGRCMNNLSSDGLSLLKHLRNLRELNLSELSNLNDLVLEQICEGCRYLQKLSIQSAGRRNPLTEQVRICDERPAYRYRYRGYILYRYRGRRGALR